MEVSDQPADDRVWGLTRMAWVQIIAVTALMCALFRFNLVRLWGKTNPINGQDPNWQHSIFVPFIGIYYLYIHRDELFRGLAERPKKELAIRIIAGVGMALFAALAITLGQGGEIGVPVMLCGGLMLGLGIPVALPTAKALGSVLLFEGLVVFAYGIFPGQNDYVKDLGMVITLFGIVTLLAGWGVMRVAWFPIVFLVVALPWPELVYARLAAPLQDIAARAAVGTLRVCNVTSQNFGTRIMMFGENGERRMLNVAEACAGLKSVMTFLMVAGTVAFLTSRPLWEKFVITLSAVPIAIFCNVVRVAGQGILDFYVSHDWSEGFAHQFAGLVMLIPGFFLILLVGWALERMFIEEVDRSKLATAGAQQTKKRLVVEVPRRELAAAAAAVAPAAEAPKVAAEKPAQQVTPPVAMPAAKPAVAPAAAPRVAPPAVAKAPAVPAAAKAPAAPAVAKTPVAPAAKAPAAAPTNVPPAPVQSPVAAPAAAAAKPVATPRVAPAAAPAARPSTLKPSTAGERAPAAPAATPASGLKASTKPAAPRVGVAPAGLKQSTLKPSAAAPRADAAAPVQRLKPSAAAATAASPKRPAPVAKPAQQQQPQNAPKSE